MGSNYWFILPGLNNSGPEHWQTHWENEYGFPRIQQRDWDAPVCEEWISTIDAVLAKQPLEKVILIAHSLACCTVVKWAEKYKSSIRGALLVGPSDTEASSYPPGTSGFMPMPLNKLPFPSIVVASNNDFYVTLERANFFAGKWGSRLFDIGPLAHINAASNIGNWPEGYAILQQLLKP